MWACSNGHKDVVKEILEYSDKIGLNPKNDDIWTALMFACHKGYKDIIQLLLNHADQRIDLNARTNRECNKKFLFGHQFNF